MSKGQEISSAYGGPVFHLQVLLHLRNLKTTRIAKAPGRLKTSKSALPILLCLTRNVCTWRQEWTIVDHHRRKRPEGTSMKRADHARTVLEEETY